MLYLSLTGPNPRLDEQGTQGVSINTARIWTSMLHHRAYAQAAGRALTCSVFREWRGLDSQGRSLAVPSVHLAKSTLPA